jgi:hypothetical protein
MPDQATAAALRSNADALRGEARLKHAVLGRTPEKAGDVSDAYAAAMTAHGLLSEMLMYRKGNDWEPDFLKSEAFQNMSSRYAAAKAVTGKALQLGSMDEGTNTMLDELFGGDPTKWKGSTESIRAAAGFLEERTGNILRANGYRPGDEEFRFPAIENPAARSTPSDEASRAIQGAQTPSEIAKAGRTSPVARAIFTPFGGETPRDRAAAERADAARSDIPGASKDQEKQFVKLEKLATGPDAKEATRARQRLLSLATDKNPDLRTAAISILDRAGLKDELRVAVEALPPKERAARAAIEATRSASGVKELESAALGGDKDAVTRLARIVIDAKSPEERRAAGEALLRIQGARGR